MKKDDLVYLYHIQEEIEDISKFTERGRISFLEEKIVKNATLRSLQTMSESTVKLSDEAKNRFPQIPWKQIRGFRNILVHDYLGLDPEVVWLVIEKELPLLLEITKKLIQVIYS